MLPRNPSSSTISDVCSKLRFVVRRDQFDGRLAGEIHASRIGPDQFAHVLSDLTVAVDPAWQGKGVGRALFAALFAAARELSPTVTRIELMAREGNIDAIRLYERLGFVMEGRFVQRVRMPDGRLEDDIAMGLLIPLGLTAHQTLVAVIVLAMTFPCIATFVVMWKELGVKKMLLSTFIMITAAMVTGGVLNLVLRLF